VSPVCSCLIENSACGLGHLVGSILECLIHVVSSPAPRSEYKPWTLACLCRMAEVSHALTLYHHTNSSSASLSSSSTTTFTSLASPTPAATTATTTTKSQRREGALWLSVCDLLCRKLLLNESRSVATLASSLLQHLLRLSLLPPSRIAQLQSIVWELPFLRAQLHALAQREIDDDDGNTSNGTTDDRPLIKIENNNRGDPNSDSKRMARTLVKEEKRVKSEPNGAIGSGAPNSNDASLPPSSGTSLPSSRIPLAPDIDLISLRLLHSLLSHMPLPSAPPSPRDHQFGPSSSPTSMTMNPSSFRSISPPIPPPTTVTIGGMNRLQSLPRPATSGMGVGAAAATIGTQAGPSLDSSLSDRAHIALFR
jgi:hypothetical protein